MIKILKITLVFLLIISVTSCKFSIEKLNPFIIPPEDKKTIKIGVSMATMNEDVYEIMKKAVLDYKKSEKANIIWENSGNSIEKQRKNINKLIKEKVDVIILHSVSTSGEGLKIVEEINKTNIPIVALDRLPNNAHVDAYISADNFKAGQLQARYLLDQMNKKGNIVILKGDKYTNVTQNITKGNKTELKKTKDVKIIEEKFHNNWSKELAKETIKKILEEHQNIKGILANNDTLALGAVEILKEENLNKKVIVVGADASKEASLAIAKEELNATIDKMPYTLGKNALKVASFIARGEDWNWDRTIKSGQHKIRLVISPVKLVDKYNINTLEDRWGILLKK